jgi:hypothetical protein
MVLTTYLTLPSGQAAESAEAAVSSFAFLLTVWICVRRKQQLAPQ